mgnify:CR=1 FL=1
MENKGIVIQVIGPVIDVRFEEKLPNIYNALHIPLEDGRKLTVEVQQHLGNNVVRTVAMDSTEGLQRGLEVIDTGNVITVPVFVTTETEKNKFSIPEDSISCTNSALTDTLSKCFEYNV